MEIRQLRLFLATVEHGSITAAADALGITQPALSKQLGRLEKQVGVSLLKRLPRGIEPTEHGRILCEHARSIDASYRSAARHLRSAKRNQHGEIVVGAGYFWLSGLLPRAVAILVNRFPDCRVQLVAGVPETLTDQLIAGDLDLVFAPLAFRQHTGDLIDSESLIRTDMQVLARIDHSAVGKGNHTLGELQQLQWALPSGTYVRKRFDTLFEGFGLTPPTPVVEVNEVSATLDIVANSDLVTLANSLSPQGEEWKKLKPIACKEISSARETGILFRKHGVLPELGNELLKIVRDLSSSHRHAVV